jgi:hypothetical protein
MAGSSAGDKVPPCPGKDMIEPIETMDACLNAHSTGKIRNAAEYRAKKYVAGDVTRARS